MPTPCDHCEIRKGCDIFSVMCRLTPADVARLRPDLILRPREPKPIRPKKPPTPEQRRANWHRYYNKSAENRKKVAKRTAAWGKANIERRRQLQREYYQRKKGRKCTT